MDFLRRSQLLADVYTDTLTTGLLAGKPFSQLLSDLQFSDTVVTQVSLAEIHGNTGLSLSKIEDYLSQLVMVRKKLVEVVTYPLMLMGFLVLIMLGLKQYLLPQIEEGNVATHLIHHLPTLFFGSIVVVGLLIVVFRVWFQRSKKIRAFSLLVKLPFVGSLITSYLTAYYAREWGNLIGQGLEMAQILQVMQEQPAALIQELGQDMQVQLANGVTFDQAIQSYPFFKRELSLIIEYGQVKSKLGSELEVYAKESWEQFFATVHKRMQLIQPLIFLFVALMIVLIYAAMLLPIYQNMEM